MTRIFFISAILLGLLAGCTPAPAPSLTLEMLRNGTYLAPTSGRTVTLEDGRYASGSDPAAADFLQVTIDEPIALGDLDQDGVEDAALLLAENMGGSGVFVSIIVVLNRDGSPTQAGSIYVDDRPMVNSLAITAGEVVTDLVLHRAEDPMCCPSWQVEKGFRLYGDELVLTHQAGATPGGMLRSITITSPADLAEVSYPFSLEGGVTIGPFENTLAYNVYDDQNYLVTAGSVMTDSHDMGLPGNFSVTLDLSMAGLTGLVRVEFVEYSMMDGSIMTLDSVLVKIP